MIKINLLAEKKPVKAKQSSSLKFEGFGGSQNILLAAVLIMGVMVAGGWWWARGAELANLKEENRKADAELVRLVEIRKKGDLYKEQKALLERKIQLITDLKNKQSVPVHILDQVSKNLPDFLWLDSMNVVNNKINITGKATTYNAVSSFYNNLIASGHFGEVVMGRASEVPEGVTFVLMCTFLPMQPTPAPEATPAPAPATGQSQARGGDAASNRG